MIPLLIVVGGLAGLWLGTELTIRGALRLAERFHLSPTFVGLTILAVGTDLPEFFVAVTAALHRLDGIETSGIAVGDAIGSCIAQIGLILGITGLSGYLTLRRRNIYRDGTMLLGSLVILALEGLDGEITRVEGLVLLTVYATYYVSLIREERATVSRERPTASSMDTKERSLVAPVLLLGIGFAIILLCSDLVVEHAVTLAERWGLRQTFVGVIILALGSSLPELVLSIGAILKKAHGLSVGNIIGSNIFDTLVPIGTGATISALTVDRRLLFIDMPILAGLSVLVFAFFLRKKGLQRREALVLVLFYCLYVAFKILQGPTNAGE